MVKIEFTPLSLDRKIFPFKKGFKKVWSLVHEISGKNKAYAGKIDGATEEDRVMTWQNQFQNLLGIPPVVSERLRDLPVINQGDVMDSEFTREEYRKVVDTILWRKERMAGGADGIRPEVLKRGGEELDRVVLGLCTRALNSGDTPTQWSEMNIVPVPKSGPLNKVANYCGISMRPMITKVINKMILMRIRPTIESVLRKNQNSFRPGRGAVPHIIALRRILEAIRDKKLPATITFIDLEKPLIPWIGVTCLRY